MATIEKDIFQKNFASFCNILKHEDGLHPHLVDKQIISVDDLDEIRSKSPAEKGPTLLRHISGPLQAGHTHRFYELLEIMQRWGKVDTQKFAESIKRECHPSSNGNKLNQDIVKVMLQARYTGLTIKVRYGKVVLVGSSAAGKTSFFRLLMKQHYCEKHISTGLAETQQVTKAMKVYIQSSTHNDDVEFKALNFDDEISQLRSYYVHERLRTLQNKTSISRLSLPKSSQPQVLTGVEEIVASNFEVENLPQQPIKDVWNILTFIDTGGQPEFISMLPAVNSTAMITFVVHKMEGGAESLHKQVTVTHGNSQGERSFTPYCIGQTNLDLIKTLISFTNNIFLKNKPFLDKISCKLGNSGTCLSIIGTHSDKVTKEDVSETDKIITRTVFDAQLKQVWMRLVANYGCLIPINNTTAGQENEDQNAVKIRKKLNQLLQEQNVYEVPIVWVLLELEIRKVCNDRKCSFIMYSEILELCKEKCLSSDEEFIKNGLRFHHLFGVLLYFEEVEGMKDLVITDHQWLFDNLAKIVCHQYSDFSYVAVHTDFAHKGIFHKSLLDKIDLGTESIRMFRSNNTKIDLKISFLCLLNHLQIAAPLKETKESSMFFMPSLLSTCNFNTNQLQFLEEYETSNSRKSCIIEPLLIQFTKSTMPSMYGTFPRGVFCCLAVYLLDHNPGWRLQWSTDEEVVFANLITFCMETGHFITLMDKILYLEIQIRHQKNIDPSTCYDVYEILCHSLNRIGQNLQFYDFQLSFSFACKCSEESHVTRYSPISKYSYCRYDRPTRLTESHLIWFKKKKPTVLQKNELPKLPSDFIENEVFKKFYSQLVSLLPTNNISHQLVSAKVITTDDIEEITAISRSKERASYVLRIVARSLEGGITSSFYALLDIMENFGGDVSALASNIRTTLIEFSDTSDDNLQSNLLFLTQQELDSKLPENLFSSAELRKMVSYEIEVVTQDKDITELLTEVMILLVTTNEDEYHAALSYFKPPMKDGEKLFQYQHYIVGRYGLFNIALQNINIQETKDLISKANAVFKNLNSIIALGILYGVENKNVERLNVLVSQTLRLYEPPNNIQVWSEIMYLPSPYDNQFENLLSKWPVDRSIIDQLSQTPSCHFADILCANFESYGEIIEKLIQENPKTDGIEIDGAGLFYKHVLNHNYNLMIVKAVCDFRINKEEKYHCTAALLAADCLHHLMSNDKMPDIFEKWLDNDKVIKRYLDQAKQCGYLVQLKHLTILLVGTSGVGKTSFLNVLQGNEPAKGHKSTDIKERIKLMLPSKFDIKSDNSWVLLDEQAQITEIYKRLRLKTLVNSNQHITDFRESAYGTTTNKDSVTSSTKDETTGTEYHNVPSEDHEKMKDTNHQSSYPMKHDQQITRQNNIATSSINEDDETRQITRQNNISTSSTINEDYETSLDRRILNCSASSKPSDTWNILTVIDTAGQPEFINLLPAINNLAKLTFVVFNMESELKNNVHVKRGDENENIDNEELHYSNLHALKYFLSTIANSARFDASVKHTNVIDKFQVCFVGTHYDKVIANQKLCDDVDNEIKAMIKQCNIHDIFFVWHDHDLVYKIDASKNYTKPGVKGDNTVAKRTIKAIEGIQRMIREIFQKSTKHISTDISLNWLLIELLIQDMCTKREMVYIERNEITNLVRKEKLEMSFAETESALKYLHNTGILLYFHESKERLSKVVFPNTNDIFKRLTIVINYVHHKKGPSDLKAIDDLVERGKLHKNLLLRGNLFKDEEEVDILLLLLEHLKIITLWTEQEESFPKNKIYFMPCVLPSWDLNKDNTAKNEPLLIHFEFGLIPPGLFCFLVVALLKENNVFSHPVGERIYNNLIRFQTITQDIVKITDWNTKLEITLEHNESKDEDYIYYRVQHDITYAFTNVWKNFKLSAAESSNLNSTDSIEYGFWCKQCETKTCIAQLPKFVSECTVCKYTSDSIKDRSWCRQCAKITDFAKVPNRTYATAKCTKYRPDINLQNECRIWFICKVSKCTAMYLATYTCYRNYISYNTKF